jgi:hypothetical protein
MGRILGVAAIALVAACGSDQTELCGAVRCDVGTVCGDEASSTCVLPDQLDACANIADGMACHTTLIPRGICRSQVCLEPVCGDGIVSPGEDCEGTNVAATCQSLGFYEGSLRCSADCHYDTSACSQRCGDGTVNGPEECDAPDGTVEAACPGTGNIVCTRCVLDYGGCS